MPIDRTWYDTLVDDSGDGISGSVWDKADVDALLDAIDASETPLIFPATMVPSANVNALDEYKEGTWTPVLTFGGAAVGMTYTLQTGRYTRIGRVVLVECSITLSAKGSSVGGATITGLPYTVAVAGGTGTIDTAVGFAGLTIPPFATSAGTTIYPMVTTATSRAQLTDANFTNTTLFTVSLFYFA